MRTLPLSNLGEIIRHNPSVISSYNIMIPMKHYKWQPPRDQTYL